MCKKRRLRSSILNLSCCRSASPLYHMRTGFRLYHAHYLGICLFRLLTLCLDTEHHSRHLMASSYDGALHLFDHAQKPLHSAPLHATPITSSCILPASSTSNDPPVDVDTHLIATASYDLTARLMRLTIVHSNVSTVPRASLHLHTAPLSQSPQLAPLAAGRIT
jgi:hypothetical protein